MNVDLEVRGDFTSVSAAMHAGTPLLFGLDASHRIQYCMLLTDEKTQQRRWSDAKPLPLSPTFRTIEDRTEQPLPALTQGQMRFVSDGRYVYAFRHVVTAANEGFFLVDRFILDMLNAALVRVLEARKGDDGIINYVDTVKGTPYYEPAVRLGVPSADGRFAVVLVPTSVRDMQRWQLFTVIGPTRIHAVSFATDADGWFTDQNRTIWYVPGDGQGGEAPQQITISGAKAIEPYIALDGVRIATGLDALVYGEQHASGDGTGLKTAAHLMLAFGAESGGMAVLDFDIAKDGTLALPPDSVPFDTIGTTAWSPKLLDPDDRQLQMSAALLTFCATTDTPFLLDSADGYVHAYHRGLDGSLRVACYDSLGNEWLTGDRDDLVEYGDWIAPGVRNCLTSPELLVVGYNLYQPPDDSVQPGFPFDRHQVGTLPVMFKGTGEYGYWSMAAFDAGSRTSLPGDWVGGGGELGAIFGTADVSLLDLKICPLGSNRLLLLSTAVDDKRTTHPWAIWQFEGDVAAGRSGALPGKWLAGGADLGAVFGSSAAVPTDVSVIALAGDRLLMHAQVASTAGAPGCAWSLWQYDPGVSGWRDAGLPGRWVGGGSALDATLDAPEGPIAVCDLGGGRLLIYVTNGGPAGRSWTAWECAFDRIGGWAAGPPPGRRVAWGSLLDTVALYQPDVANLGACALGAGRILFYTESGGPGLDPSHNWSIWEYDAAVTGDCSVRGFPGRSIARGDDVGPVFGTNREAPRPPALRIAPLNASVCHGQPFVLELGALVTDADGLIVTDAGGNPTGAMYRIYIRQTHQTRTLASVVQVSEIEAHRLDEVTIDPTLVGYIEGAPPVPLENLDPDHTSTKMAGWNPEFRHAIFTFTTEDKAAASWSSSRDVGIDAKIESDATVEGGVGVVSGKVKRELSLEASYGFLADSEVVSAVTRVTQEKLEVKGAVDPDTQLWSPYNHGRAFLTGARGLVIGLSLKGSKRIISYQIVPIEESDTAQSQMVMVRFPINRFYTKQGTLDGLLWGAPDPDYASAKPGDTGHSYFKPDEEAALRDTIARREKQREAFYTQYNANAFNALSDEDRAEVVQKSVLATSTFDPDGGKTETIVMSSMVQASVGGSFHVKGMAGISVEASVGDVVAGVGAKATAGLSYLFGAHLELTVKKSAQTEHAVTITSDINLDTDPSPGRVMQYDFTTFLLEPDLANFHDFFDRVVDPAWIQGSAGQDDRPEMLQLQRAMNRPSPAWRILHRASNIRRYS